MFIKKLDNIRKHFCQPQASEYSTSIRDPAVSLCRGRKKQSMDYTGTRSTENEYPGSARCVSTHRKSGVSGENLHEDLQQQWVRLAPSGVVIIVAWLPF